jgi:hypothetical protein
MPASINTRPAPFVNYQAARRQALDRNSFIADIEHERAKAAAPAAPKEKGPSVEMLVAKEAARGGLLGELALGEQREDAPAPVWRWTGRLWQLIEEERAYAEITHWLMTQASEKVQERTVKGSWRITRWHLAKAAGRKPMPNPKRIMLALRGGYLEVAANQIIGRQPSKDAGLSFEIQASCPVAAGGAHTPQPVPAGSLFGRFLAMSMPDAAEQGLLQEQCALTLTGRANEMIAWWHGGGRNGKSTMLKLLAAFHPSPRPLVLHELGDRFGLEDIVGASLLMVSEVDPEKKMPVDRLKALSSADPVRVQRKGLGSIAYINTADTIVAANEMPRYHDSSNGFARRLCPLEWRHWIADDQVIADLGKRIIDEESGVVLDWLLIGLQRIAKRGGFMPENEWPGSVARQKMLIVHDNDVVRRCVDEEGWVYDPDLPKRPRAELWAAWLDWCESAGLMDNDRPPIRTPNQLMRQLRKLGEPHHFRDADLTEKIGTGPDRIPACRISLGIEDAAKLRAKADREAAQKTKARHDADHAINNPDPDLLRSFPQ